MTFKEFMHTPNPELDRLAAEAETAREIAEDIAYDRRIEMKDKTLNQLLAEADTRSKDQDAHNNREEIKPNTFEKEINTMDENTTKGFKIKGDITSKIMNTICSMAIDYNILPVDLGFKLNNLTETEFKLYADLLKTTIDEQGLSKIEYPDPKTRDKRFYDFRALNLRLVKSSIPASPVQPKDYHIPTSFEIRAKNNCDWKDLEIAYLKERLNNAADAYRFMEAIVQDYESKQPKRRKTSVKK